MSGEVKKVECVCTYNKDMGKLSVTETKIQFRSLHHDATIPVQQIQSVKKKGQKTITIRTQSESYTFGPFDDVRRGVVFEALKTIVESQQKESPDKPSGGGINVNTIKGLDDQIVKDLFDEPVPLSDVPSTMFTEPDEKSETLCIDETYPIKLKYLFALLLSDSSNFLEELHTKEGDIELQFNPWKLDETKAFYTRLFDFRKKSKLVNTLVHQTQSVRLRSKTELLVETSNKMEGIPFADCFTVDTKWRVTEEGGSSCRIKVFVKVNFTKAVSIVKGKIERSSIQGTVDYFKALAAAVKSKFTGDDDEDSTNPVGPQKPKAGAGSSADKFDISIIAIALGVGCILFFILWLWYWWSAGNWAVYVAQLESENLKLTNDISHYRSEIENLRADLQSAGGPCQCDNSIAGDTGVDPHLQNTIADLQKQLKAVQEYFSLLSSKIKSIQLPEIPEADV